MLPLSKNWVANILFKLKYDLTLFGGKDKEDANQSKAPSNPRPRGNRGGGRLR